MSGKAKKPYRRRIVYIHKTFQRNFIFKFCLIALCAMIAASLLVYGFSKNTLTATYRYHHLALQRTGEAILPALVITNLVVLLAFLGATILVTLYVSHKIAGPLYRLGSSLESVGRGDLSLTIRLREHDQLMDFASTLNRTIESLKERVTQIQKEVDELREKTRGDGWSPEEVRGDMESLHRKIHELFKTGGQGES
ncbi:MAG: methyl-accepting chemotaxis protein [Deltaproteobacteria bacterium]|nr:methyl-accepting chemotaxis protein [Deltaproteobacteria bacterium]